MEEEMYEQSGVVPFRSEEGRLQLLLITSMRRKQWIFPKGSIEEGLSPTDSAAKEALEEAGVTGIVYPNEIGYYQYQRWNGTYRVRLFLMQVEEILDDWPEAGMRQRQWCNIHEASAKIIEEGLLRILNQLPWAIKNEI